MERKIALYSLFHLPSSLALFVRALWCKQRSLFSNRFRKRTWGSCSAVDNVNIIHFSRSVLHFFPFLTLSLPPTLFLCLYLPPRFARWFNFISYPHSPDRFFLYSEPILPQASQRKSWRGFWERSHLRPRGNKADRLSDRQLNIWLKLKFRCWQKDLV